MIVCILTLILLMSLYLASKYEVKTSTTKIESYFQRVLYYYISIYLLLMVIAWFIILPIVGLFNII